MLSTWKLVLLVGLPLIACGCGVDENAGVIVTGKIVKGGVPLEMPHRDVGLSSVEVILLPVEGAARAEREGTTANEDGSFVL